LLAAELCSSVGSQLTRLALPWFVLVETGSAARMAFVFAAQLLPVALLGLPSGAVVERLGARTVMVAGDLARAPLVALVPLLHSLELLTFPLLLVLALALGVAPVHLLVPLDEQWYAVTPDRVTGTSRVREWLRGNWPMHGADPNDPAARLADRDTYLAQRPAPDDDWTAPPEPTPDEREAARRERLRKLAEAEEAGLVTIQRHDGGGWTVTPTDGWTEQVLGEADDGDS